MTSRALRAAIVVCLSAASIAASATGCKKGDVQASSDKSATPQAPPTAAHFAKVVEKTLPRRLEISGTLDADEQSELAAQTPGDVLKVNVDIGSRVKKGDIIVELDPREASLKYQSATAAAQQQRARLGLDKPGAQGKFDNENVADVRSAKEAYDLASADFDRSQALFNEGAIPKAQLDQAKSTKERAQAAYEVAKNSTQQTYAGLAGADAQAGLTAKSLDDTKIRAPFDGVIAEKRISPGEYAPLGKVVVVLVKDDPLRLRFDVAESDIGNIAQGAKVEIRVAAFPDKPFDGLIKRIGASVKVQSRTLPVEAEVPNADRMLKPGFFARASIALNGDPVPTLLVPKTALVPGASGSRIFVRNNDRVTERLVTTGASLGDLVEVKGQLAVNEEIAIDNVDKLSDAAPITVAP